MKPVTLFRTISLFEPTFVAITGSPANCASIRAIRRVRGQGCYSPKLPETRQHRGPPQQQLIASCMEYSQTILRATAMFSDNTYLSDTQDWLNKANDQYVKHDCKTLLGG